MEEFNILEFIKYYMNKVIYIVLVTIIGILLGVFYTYGIQVPVYKSSTSLVLAKNGDSSSGLTQGEIAINKNLVSTYREIIKSRRILEQVIYSYKLNVTYKELASNVEVTSVNDTELIVISVYNENSKLAAEIANKIASVFKNEIVTIYNIENVSIIDNALASENPDNVNVVKQIVLGGFAGFLLCSLIIFICYYFDDTIKSAIELEEKLSLPVIGSVPKCRKKSKGGEE